MTRKKLSAAEIESALAHLNGWENEGVNLTKRFEFADFTAALAFVNRVGAISEERDHHPDINFGWGYAELSITTHDAGGLTEFDVALAKSIDELGSGEKR